MCLFVCVACLCVRSLVGVLVHVLVCLCVVVGVCVCLCGCLFVRVCCLSACLCCLFVWRLFVRLSGRLFVCLCVRVFVN